MAKSIEPRGDTVSIYQAWLDEHQETCGCGEPYVVRRIRGTKSATVQLEPWPHPDGRWAVDVDGNAFLVSSPQHAYRRHICQKGGEHDVNEQGVTGH